VDLVHRKVGKPTVRDENRRGVLVKAGEQINDAALSWSGVAVGPHRFGGKEYRLGRREIGHVHGDYLVDIPFPKHVRNELVAAGLAEPHHILPDSGWISFYIKDTADAERAIALLRRSYDLAMAASASRVKHSESET
jgi:hypothetical protein